VVVDELAEQRDELTALGGGQGLDEVALRR
jgi:hypothetical protein